MKPANDSVVHVASWAWTLGGIQSTLRHHHASEPESRFVSVFDRPDTLPARAVSLRAHGRLPVAALRSRFQAVAATIGPGATWIYHDGWGLHWWSDLDQASRRIVYLQTEMPNLDVLLPELAARADGFLCVSQSLADRILHRCPEISPERVVVPPYFVQPPRALAPTEPIADGVARPWRIGCAGRLERAQKRSDRLPALIAALDATGLDYTFEILGEGSYASELDRALGDHPRVRRLGRRDGEAYWAVLRGWDCHVLVSDFEGFSRVTMETMMAGAMPVHPDLSPASAELLGPCAAKGLYPCGDMAAAAQCIVHASTLAQAERNGFQTAARDHLAAHTPERYATVVREALERIRSLPRCGGEPEPAAWESWLPLGVYTRLFRRRF